MSKVTDKLLSDPIIYSFEAYAPDPRGGDNFIKCGGEVGRNKLIDSGLEFMRLMEGISDHIFGEIGIRCRPESIRLHKLELEKDAFFRQQYPVTSE